MDAREGHETFGEINTDRPGLSKMRGRYPLLDPPHTELPHSGFKLTRKSSIGREIIMNGFSCLCDKSKRITKSCACLDMRWGLFHELKWLPDPIRLKSDTYRALMYAEKVLFVNNECSIENVH